MKWPRFTIDLPGWAQEYCATLTAPRLAVTDRMEVAITLSRLNVLHGTGGPFGAAIFERATGRFVAPGMNLVVGSHCSVAHAEIVAIMIAQSVLQTYNLATAAGAPYELVASTEPCAMCMGAIPWSGVNSLVCGARDEDARDVGFEEGDKPADWKQGYRSRGIDVQCGVLSKAAAQVLRDYAASGGPIYNANAME